LVKTRTSGCAMLGAMRRKPRTRKFTDSVKILGVVPNKHKRKTDYRKVLLTGLQWLALLNLGCLHVEGPRQKQPTLLLILPHYPPLPILCRLGVILFCISYLM
jgi:hypothetical protein